MRSATSPPSTSLRERPIRDRVQTLLTREIAFVFSRKLLNPQFVAEHRQVTQRVLATLPDEASTKRTDSSGYLALIGQNWKLPPLLTPDEERSLFVTLNSLRYQANAQRSQLNPRRPARARITELERLLSEADAVRQHLVDANVRLVISLASRMSDALLSFDDLFSEGLLILLKTIDGFDFSKGFRFSTYATNSLQRHFFRLRKRTLRKRQFGTPIDDDVLRTASNGSTGDQLTPDDPRTLTRTILQAARRQLDPRERRILELRFGLQGSEHTLREIATLLRVSKERVRQVLARAVGKLQSAATQLRLEWTPRELTPPARLGL